MTHIGVVGELPGGMAQVVNEYLAWDFTDLQVRAVASTTGRGDRWALLRTARCALVVLATVFSGRPQAFVLHLSSGGSFVREAGLAAVARLCGFPVAVQLHGSDFAEFADERPGTVRRALRLAHRVYVLTDETEAIVREALGAKAEGRVARVANGVAVPDSVPAKEPLVVFAGLVGPRKGADVLLEAWPVVQAAHPRWRLVVAGPVESALPPFPALPGVTMLGSVDRDEVLRWQSRAAVAVLPSRYEALPMSLLEAMARRCAVVATPVGQVEELVEGCGVLVPVGDAGALATALDGLVRAPGTVARLGEAGHARIQERYSEAAVARLLEREWRILLGCGRRGAAALRAGRPPRR